VGDCRPEHVGRLVTQHTAIVDAIAQGNAVEAQDLMRTHLREVLTTMLEFGIAKGGEVSIPRVDGAPPEPVDGLLDTNPH
jgi:hypothetical protein